jgi:serine/threonine protein kinase
MLTKQYSWHQDIKPSNILITSGRSGSNFDCEFKLADLGLSHFRKAQGSHVAAIDKDTSGTREYGRLHIEKQFFPH